MKNVFRIAAVLSSIISVSFAIAEQGIRKVDFRNSIYDWDGLPQYTPMSWHWIESPAHSRIRLVRGLHKFIDQHAPEEVRQASPLLRFDSVSYGDLDGDGIEEAAVALNYSTGGTANWDYLYIYKLDRGSLKLMGRLESGSRAAGGLIKASIKEGLLVLEFDDLKRSVGECCSEGYIRVFYRFRDGHFIEEGTREKGDL